MRLDAPIQGLVGDIILFTIPHEVDACIAPFAG